MMASQAFRIMTTGDAWLIGLSLLVFFAISCQCMSTLAAVKRETKSYKWPAFMFVYMTGLAYLLSRMRYEDGFPEPIGVFRAVDRPKYDELLNAQIAEDQVSAETTVEERAARVAVGGSRPPLAALPGRQHPAGCRPAADHREPAGP